MFAGDPTRVAWAHERSDSGDVCSGLAVAPQHGAAYVQGTAGGYGAVVVGSADVGAAAKFPRRTGVHGHRLPGVQRLTAALAHARGVRRGRVAVRQFGHRFRPIRWCSCFPSTGSNVYRAPASVRQR